MRANAQHVHCGFHTDVHMLANSHVSSTVALAAQRHQEAVSQSGRQVRGGDDHRVRAHSVEKVHDLETVSE